MTFRDPLDTKAWRREQDALLQRFYMGEIKLPELRAGLEALGYHGAQLELDLVMHMIIRDTTPNDPRPVKPSGFPVMHIIRTRMAFPTATIAEIAALCGVKEWAARTALRHYRPQETAR